MTKDQKEYFKMLIEGWADRLEELRKKDLIEENQRSEEEILEEVIFQVTLGLVI